MNTVLDTARLPASAARDAAFSELEQCMCTTLETYANVHRGAGFKSLATTAIFEHAREIVLEYAALDRDRFEVVFCPPGTAHELQRLLSHPETRLFSSAELGLPLGVRAIVADRRELSALKPLLVGGGAVDLVSPRTVVWSKAAELFEAGTPAVVNIAAFAKALLIAQRAGRRVFLDGKARELGGEEILRGGELPGGEGTELLARFRDSLIGRHFPVPAGQGDAAHVNFDNAASTSTPLAVWETAKAALRQGVFQGDLAAIVKRDLAAFLGAPAEDYEVIFTGNTTGAINLAAHLLARNQLRRKDAVVLNTWVEHNSNELPWRVIPGVSLKKIPLAADGLVDIDRFAAQMRRYRQRVVLVAVSGASNVTGQPIDIERICAIAREHGALTLVDGAQLFAHRRLDLQRIGVDFFAFSGHKAYAPFGAGALVARRDCLTQGPSVLNAIRRAGEENGVGIAALGKAVRLLGRIGMDTIEAQELRLSRRIVRGISRIPRVHLYAVHGWTERPSSWRGGVVAFHVSGSPHNLTSKALAESSGIGTRSGCFCAHLFVQRLLRISRIRVRLAGLFLRLSRPLAKQLLPGLVRASVGAENDETDVDALVKAVERVASCRPSPSDRLLARYRCGSPRLPSTRTSREIETRIVERIWKVYALEVGSFARPAHATSERN